MPVWTLQSPGATSEKTVVAIHGGGFIVRPTIFHWLNYAAMARDTGATVIVPIYPLIPEGGTAGTVVPAMADLISLQIDQHGAENVSVHGDSAGGTMALAAVQELVRRGDPVPSHMVLFSPALDATLSNPAIQFVDDPLFSGRLLATVHENAQLWAGDLDLTDPLVSPLYGSLAGLPPTAVYYGNLEITAPDGLVLQHKALATPGADFTFILRNGEIHDWAVFTILPETQAVLPDVYRQLGIGSQVEDPWTGEPSFVHELVVGAFRVIGAVGGVFGAQSPLTLLGSPNYLGALFTGDSPPSWTTSGLNVQRSEFEGMPVWTLQAPGSASDKYVVGIPGGGYVYQPSLFHWLEYATWARDTGATVVVPVYPLAPQGTAATVVPVMADLISSQIDQHGAQNVSVYGDSAGGGLALAAVQELVRRGNPVPSHMVLISPALDATLSDPASQTIDDPALNYSEAQGWVRLWAGDLDLADPRVSPLYGSLVGLPPTAVYSGSLDLLSPQALRLRERALAEGVDMTFVLREGLIHNWAAGGGLLLPEALDVRPDIYEQLGIVGSETLLAH
jgi:triacylglycerol lipase